MTFDISVVFLRSHFFPFSYFTAASMMNKQYYLKMLLHIYLNTECNEHMNNGTSDKKQVS